MQNSGGCLENLTKLWIELCDNLESLPEGWYAATNLRKLWISGCSKLEGLPLRAYNNNNNNNHHVTSLQELTNLTLESCAAAKEVLSRILKEESSLSSSYFTNLTSLHLLNVEVGKPPPEWGLHRLSSLRQLWLGSYGWESFPEDGMLWLPPSLIDLTIREFPNLEKLSCKEFQNLPSLELLNILYCYKLVSITELGQLSSLSKLWIRICPNLLASFAKQGLPPSLLLLHINDCPKLKQGFEKGRGQYWRFISHIPEVEIDYKFIFDPQNIPPISVLGRLLGSLTW